MKFCSTSRVIVSTNQMLISPSKSTCSGIIYFSGLEGHEMIYLFKVQVQYVINGHEIRHVLLV